MSDSESEKSVEIIKNNVDDNKTKFKGYSCDRCGYQTKRLKHFISHITRKIPCYIVKNYDYGVEKAMEKYKLKSLAILEMLEKIENKEEIDINKLIKYVNEVERLGRINPEYKQEDVDEIKEIIKGLNLQN